MPQRNVNLTDHFDQFIDKAIDSGRFSNASEIVREGLRLLEQRESEDNAKIEWLRNAAVEGFHAIDRGESVALTSDVEIDVFLRRIRKQTATALSEDIRRA